MDNFDGYIADIYREMESELIASMKRNLGLHEAEEALTGLKYPQWQAMKLKEIQRFQRENVRIMGKKLKGLPKEVSRHMVDELRQGSKHELRRYKKALKKGYKPAKVMKDSFFKINDKKVEGLINALNNDLAKANTAVLRMMNDQYRQTIFKAGMFVSNGVYTEEQAVKKAVEEFEKKGLNCIEYKNGRRVNIADYTSMAVRTANQRAYMVGEGEFRKAIGETLVIISRHSTSCPLCKPFENKVLIDDVYSGGTQADGDYMLLSEAMAQGLYHPRCRHGLGTYYPELEGINGYQQKNNKPNDLDIEKSEKIGTTEKGGTTSKSVEESTRKLDTIQDIDNRLVALEQRMADSTDFNEWIKIEEEQERLLSLRKQKVAEQTQKETIQRVQAAEKTLKNQGYFIDDESKFITQVNLTGCDADCAESVVNAYDKVFEKMPFLRGKFAGVEVADGLPAGAMAEALPLGGNIKISSNYFSNYKKLKQAVHNNNTRGFTVATDPEDLVIHEIGHAFSFYAKNDWMTDAGYTAMVRKQGTIAEAAKKAVIKDCGTSGNISAYAGYNSDEWFAEMFTLYIKGESNDVAAQSFARYIDKLYGTGV